MVSVLVSMSEPWWFKNIREEMVRSSTLSFPDDDVYNRIVAALKLKKGERGQSIEPYLKARIQKKFSLLNLDGEEIVVDRDGKKVLKQSRAYSEMERIHRAWGHCGREQTFAKVKEEYATIPVRLVSEYVRRCPMCCFKKKSGYGNQMETSLSYFVTEGDFIMRNKNFNAGQGYGAGSSAQYDDNMAILPKTEQQFEDDETLLCEAEEIEEKYTPHVELYESQPGTSSDADSVATTGTKRTFENSESPSLKRGKSSDSPDLITAQDIPETITVTPYTCTTPVEQERPPSPEVSIITKSNSVSLKSDTWSNSKTEDNVTVNSSPKKLSSKLYNSTSFNINSDEKLFEMEERKAVLDLEKRRVAMEEKRLQIEIEERRRRIELDEQRLIMEEEDRRSKRDMERKKLELEERRVVILEKRSQPEINHWKKIDSVMQQSMVLFGKIIAAIGKVQDSKLSEKTMEVVNKVLDRQHNLTEAYGDEDNTKKMTKTEETKSSTPQLSDQLSLTSTDSVKDKNLQFSTNELECLIDGVHDYMNVLALKDEEVTEEQMNVAWQDVTQRVNKVSKTVRTSDEVRHKWLCFKNNTKNKAMRTPPELTELEMRILEMLADESMEELEAAFDVEDLSERIDISRSPSPRQFAKRDRISENVSSPVIDK